MKTLDLDLKLESLTEKGEFEGLASVYGNKDSDGEIVVSGAFEKSIKERGDRVPLLWMHKRDEPIGNGKVEHAAHGLSIKGRLNLAVSRAVEIYELMKEGTVKGLSIGAKVINRDWDRTKDAYLLTELKLYEVSLVTFAANELAAVGAVKFDGVASIYDALSLLKAGRTLSSATRARVQQTINELQALLAESDSDGAAKSAIEPDLFHSMVSDWQKASILTIGR